VIDMRHPLPEAYELVEDGHCGDHEVAAYLAQINAMKRQFLRLAAEM